MATTTESCVKNRFLIMSDSHGEDLLSKPVSEPVDVVIHCGDLTEESKIEEFQRTLHQLRNITADLKLVITGNHDFTMDILIFRKLVAGVQPALDPHLVRKEYGDYGEVRQLFEDIKSADIIFLEEGTHHFNLQNGASLIVYASPFTPSLSGDWGFQYHPDHGHDFLIPNIVDVVITHGPPKGIMDYTESRQRAGCLRLFEAIAHAWPRLHCFGHIYEG
jgi:predicted phosphodiesterase